MAKIRKYISIFTVASALLALISYITLFICRKDASMADTIDRVLGMPLRRALSFISNKTPRSIFEILVFLTPLFIILIIFLSVRRFRSGEGRIKFLLNILGILLIVYTLYVLTMGIAYHKTKLAEKIGINEVEVSAENLKSTAEILINEINTLSAALEYKDGESRMQYDIDELSERISVAYSALSEKYGLFPSFSSRAKPVLASNAMSSLRILGIYTFFTGESNINVSYPDFDLAYTVTHEFAHQRGVLRENEANFIAFLACIESSDSYIKYSGYLRLYEYIRSALYATDKELFRAVDAALCDNARSDIRASGEVTKKYGDTFIGEISNKINDFYLKQNGTEGVASYGLVTRLAVSYYEDSQK